MASLSSTRSRSTSQLAFSAILLPANRSSRGLRIRELIEDDNGDAGEFQLSRGDQTTMTYYNHSTRIGQDGIGKTKNGYRVLDLANLLAKSS